MNIQSVDGEEPTHDELAKIHETKCIQCKKRYTLPSPIIFTTTKKGLIWWHTQCRYSFDKAKYRKEYQQREKAKEYVRAYYLKHKAVHKPPLAK